jgi:hypothetical protein
MKFVGQRGAAGWENRGLASDADESETSILRVGGLRLVLAITSDRLFANETFGASRTSADRHLDGYRQVLLDMPGVFAEFETSLPRVCQLEGIARAKAAGVYRGLE